MAVWADDELRNWAQVYCGSIGTELLNQSSSPTPREADAAIIEAALCDMRRERGRLFEAIMLRYRDHYMDVTASQQMKCSIPTFRNMIDRAYHWLDGRVSRRVA